MSTSSRDQALMLGTKQPASAVHTAGVAQVQMQLSATSVVNATSVSSIQLDLATKTVYQKAYAKDPTYKKFWKTKRASSDYEVHDGLIYLKGDGNVRRLCVPNHRQLGLDVIHNVRDAAIMAHPGFDERN
ncbi:hypothetical protein PI124_g9677 [Phytophthora idaei]|nr:hypothetical protein PI125_g4676 [Phytophthora idaei]KAG3166569.1 hypothetical protein PI126_g4140 [Phytophthora idaei]KAG3245580.1 hypothetical protein PI124_g9677 [Phytophthora idaei]